MNQVNFTASHWACLVRGSGMELESMGFKFFSFLLGEEFKGNELKTWGYQVSLKSKGLETPHHQGISSSHPLRIKLLIKNKRKINSNPFFHFICWRCPVPSNWINKDREKKKGETTAARIRRCWLPFIPSFTPEDATHRSSIVAETVLWGSSLFFWPFFSFSCGSSLIEDMSVGLQRDEWIMASWRGSDLNEERERGKEDFAC